MFSRTPLGCMGLLQRLLAPIPEPRDIGIQTLALVVWPAGAGGGNWLVEGLGVGGQRLPALASLGDVLPPWWHVGEAGASALGTSEKWGHELRPLGKEVFLAEQVRPVLASWQLSPGSFQPPWRERCDFDISGKWKGKGAASAESPSPGERARASASVKRVSRPGAVPLAARPPSSGCGSSYGPERRPVGAARAWARRRTDLSRSLHLCLESQVALSRACTHSGPLVPQAQEKTSPPGRTRPSQGGLVAGPFPGRQTHVGSQRARRRLGVLLVPSRCGASTEPASLRRLGVWPQRPVWAGRGGGVLAFLSTRERASGLRCLLCDPGASLTLWNMASLSEKWSQELLPSRLLGR